MISSDIYTTNGDKFSINIDSSATVHDLKIYLEKKYGISSKCIKLILQNENLNDSMYLNSIEFGLFPGVMMEYIDLSKPNESNENDKKDPVVILPNISEVISNTVNIAKLKEIPCTQFSLDYSFSRSVPVKFLSIDPTLNKNAILNSGTTIGDIFTFMNYNHSQFNLYSVRKVLFENERLSDIGFFQQFSFRAAQNIKQKSKKLKELKIVYSNNNPFHVPVSENTYVSELKRYIAFNNSQTKPENVLLYFTNILLNDSKQLSYYNIPNKSTLIYSILKKNDFIILLIFGNSQSAEYQLKNKNIRICDFQRMIELPSAIPIEKMFLFIDNILFEDTEKKFNDLTKKNHIEIEIRTKNDPFFLIQSDDKKEFFYKIDVKISDSIFNIKKKISELFNILIGDQILFYNNIELKDSLLIYECEIEFGSVLELNLIPTPSYFSISIAYKGQNHILDKIHQNLYIRDLKQLIADKTNDPINEIDLTIQPRKLEDTDMLSNLHIKGGLTLFLCPKFTPININVITALNDNFNFIVYPEMTIKIFKQILDCVLGQLNQQILVFFNGKQVSEENTFQYIGITESSTLYVLFQ